MVSTESRILSYISSTVSLQSLPLSSQRALAVAPEVPLLTFIRSIYFELKNNPVAEKEFSDLFEIVNVSGYTFNEWLANFNHVYAWLSENKKRAKFSDVIQYVSCYLESQSADSIEVFLEIFGFERTISC